MPEAGEIISAAGPRATLSVKWDRHSYPEHSTLLMLMKLLLLLHTSQKRSGWTGTREGLGAQNPLLDAITLGDPPLVLGRPCPVLPSAGFHELPQKQNCSPFQAGRSWGIPQPSRAVGCTAQGIFLWLSRWWSGAIHLLSSHSADSNLEQ